MCVFALCVSLNVYDWFVVVFRFACVIDLRVWCLMLCLVVVALCVVAGCCLFVCFIHISVLMVVCLLCVVLCACLC